MGKSYNGLNAYKINLAEIGICPECGARFGSGTCEHTTMTQFVEWAHLEITEEADVDLFLSVANLCEDPEIGCVSEPDEREQQAAECRTIDDWLQPADRAALAYGDADLLNWGETSESYKNSQPYHNDLYPYF